jgi:CheY-like chemotaxis protein
LRETIELLTPGIPENIEFRLDLPDDEHPVMADPGQLQQVIANLVLNAGHAMPDGGLLVVAVSRVGTEDDSGPVPPEIRMGDWIRISISDTGTGIPKSVQHRVFEPFFTTKSAHGGTGLGLAQVYGNIKQHGGHVEFETSDGIGTTFFVFLPMFTYHTGSKVESSPRGRGETILVVEDELAVLTATAQSLRSLGYSVLEATDGSDALHFVKEGKNVDLVLTDVRMPGEDGIRLAGRIRKLLPDVKILVMTGYASQLSKGNNAPEGVLGVLHKPFSMDYLAREVHRVLIS